MREIIIIVGHGSTEADADGTADIADQLHGMLHTDCSKDCVRVAYLQFMKPELKEALGNAAEEGINKIVIHPFLLSKGFHVTKNIPQIIENFQNAYPDIEVICTAPLGVHEKLAEVVLKRIKEAVN